MTWVDRMSAERLAAADARTLAIELMVASHRQSQLAVDPSDCASAGCGVELSPAGELDRVIPGQARAVVAVRVVRTSDGSVSTELMEPGFRYDGRTLDARRVGMALWSVSGGDPRLGVVDGSENVGPSGARPASGVSAFSAGSVIGQSR
jgi:hypothetical protein